MRWVKDAGWRAVGTRSLVRQVGVVELSQACRKNWEFFRQGPGVSRHHITVQYRDCRAQYRVRRAGPPLRGQTCSTSFSVGCIENRRKLIGIPTGVTNHIPD